MPRFLYGSRNGMSTIVHTIKKLCDVYNSFLEPILTYINDSSLTDEQKATVIAWLNGASAACAIISLITITDEK